METSPPSLHFLFVRSQPFGYEPVFCVFSGIRQLANIMVEHVCVCISLKIEAQMPHHIQIHAPCATFRRCRCPCAIKQL